MILLLEQNTARVEHSGRKTYLEGIFLPVGNQPTANKRLYTTEHLNDLVSDLQPTIKEGGLVGELNHNNASQNVDIDRVSHVVKSLRHKGDGQFLGRAEVLKEGAGKLLQSAIDAGMRIGTSVKATGDVKKMPDGNSLVLPESYRLISIDAVHAPANGQYVKSIKESILSESYTPNEKELALRILAENLGMPTLEKLGHGLADQQRRMNYDPSSVLYAGHSGYSNLPDDPRSHYERLLADTLDMIEKLADLQSRMRNTDGSAQDNQGFSTDTRHLNFSYADAIRDPIKRAQVKQQLWNARTNEIMRNRALQQLSRISKYNKG